MRPPLVICAGLSCLDLCLHNTTPPATLEQITPFTHTTHTPGGSAPQTALSLTSLGVPATILTLIGSDAHGHTLTNLLSASGIDTTGITRHPTAPTSLSVLPVFTDGRRGCFVTLGANEKADPASVLAALAGVDVTQVRVFHFGYPHLMPLLRGDALADMFASVRRRIPRVALSLDLNGADVDDRKARVVGPSLQLVDFVHANLEEACVVSGLFPPGEAGGLSVVQVAEVVRWFVRGGLVVAVTAGRNGVFVGRGEEEEVVYRSAFAVSEGVIVNASGAGDAFVAGVLALMAGEGVGDHSRLADAGLASALRRIEPGFGEGLGIGELVEAARKRARIPPSPELKIATGG